MDCGPGWVYLEVVSRMPAIGSNEATRTGRSRKVN